MIWPAKNNKGLVDVRRLMARLLNKSFSSGSLVEPEHEARQESRSNVNIPVIVVVIDDDPNSDPNINTGVTHDISCEGMTILSEHSIPHGDLIVGFGPFDDWHVLKCTCLRTTSVGYGYFESAAQIGEQQNVVAPHQRHEHVQFSPLSNSTAAEAALDTGLPDRHGVPQNANLAIQITQRLAARPRSIFQPVGDAGCRGLT